MTVPAPVKVATPGARDLGKLRGFYRRLGWPLAVDLDDFAAFQTAGAVLALFPLERLAADGRVPSAAPELGMRGFSGARRVGAAGGGQGDCDRSRGRWQDHQGAG